MKKNIIKMLAAVALIGSMAACSDDDKTVPAVNIDEQTVTIDGNQQTVSTDGEYSAMLPYGSHTYKVRQEAISPRVARSPSAAAT